MFKLRNTTKSERYTDFFCDMGCYCPQSVYGSLKYENDIVTGHFSIF